MGEAHDLHKAATAAIDIEGSECSIALDQEDAASFGPEENPSEDPVLRGAVVDF